MNGSLDTGSIPVGSTKKTMENDTFSIVFFIHCESNGISSALTSMSSAIGCILFRNDDIQNFVLMIYRNKLRMIYNGKPLIF